MNEAAINIVNAEWTRNVHKLYCHIHPLDTFASEIKKCLRDKEVETEAKKLWKSGCVAEQILAVFDRLR